MEPHLRSSSNSLPLQLRKIQIIQSGSELAWQIKLDGLLF